MKPYTHNTGAFIGKEGFEIFFQSWSVPSPKAIVVIVHGVGEHSGRYAALADDLTSKKISVYALDHRGHGRSGGKRGHVNSFDDYIYDLKQFIEYVSEEKQTTPVMLLGQSMGGVIALKYGLTYPEDLASMMISAPGLIMAFEIPEFKLTMINFLSKYLPSLSLASGLKIQDLSRDLTVVDAYENDPMVHGRITPRWAIEFKNAGEECLARASEIKMPILLLHGTEDKICDYSGSVKIYENAGSKIKELHLLNPLYHEPMNELKDDRKKVIDIILKWIEKISSKKKTSEKKPAAANTKAAAAVKKKPAAQVKKKAAPIAKKKPAGPAKKKAAPSVKKTTAAPVKKKSPVPKKKK